ncbi:hypothetical protein [Sneathiella sp.]|uniref:hypothetical protein n=1 Tax=Sneathiella sp. TaxID=1964365 RepID=UPI0035631C9A
MQQQDFIALGVDRQLVTPIPWARNRVDQVSSNRQLVRVCHQRTQLRANAAVQSTHARRKSDLIASSAKGVSVHAIVTVVAPRVSSAFTACSEATAP